MKVFLLDKTLDSLTENEKDENVRKGARGTITLPNRHIYDEGMKVWRIKVLSSARNL